MLFGTKTNQAHLDLARSYIMSLKPDAAAVAGLITDRVDSVMAEHMTLILFAYLCRKKVDAAAMPYFGEAILDTSTYGRSYQKNRRKELQTINAAMQTMKDRSQFSRHAGLNALEEVVKVMFKDFSAYKNPAQVKAAVRQGANRLIETKGLTAWEKYRFPEAKPATHAYDIPSSLTLRSGSTSVKFEVLGVVEYANRLFLGCMEDNSDGMLTILETDGKGHYTSVDDSTTDAVFARFQQKYPQYFG